jgi:hypothetical protein
MRGMSDLARWRSRAADPDVASAASVWANPAAPRTVLADPSKVVVDYLVNAGAADGTLRDVLHNPAVPDSVRAALARRATGPARTAIARYATDPDRGVRTMVALAAVLTPATLEKIVNGLRFGWHHRQDPDAARARLAELMRAFITSAQNASRALAAEAFPLTLDARHHYREGEVSATRLVADTEVAVRVGLARNPHMRGLPETPDGLRVRQTLLQDPNPRVRTAARRAGVHVTSGHIEAAFAAAHGLPTIDDPLALDSGDALDDPAAAVRATAVAAGIHRQDGARWSRVLADPHPSVRKAAATHGFLTPRFVWTELASDPDPGVRKAVAMSRWAPTEVQRRLLSDADPAVATAAQSRDPLARPVRVRSTLPAGAEIALPVSLSPDPMVRLLDITVATLTLDQQRRLARAAADHTARAEARSHAIRELGHGDHARWVVNRWIRWTDLFALPAPISGLAWVADQVAAPFAALDAADDRVAGALALFDAALGLVATPDTAQGHADRAVLTAAWERVCLPASRTHADVYGPRTPEVARYLTEVSRRPASVVDTLLTTRIGIDAHQWAAARADAVDVAPGPDQHLYVAHHLFWDCAAVAELATGEHPTDPMLAEALWGAAATIAYAERLPPACADILSQPWIAAGLPPIDRTGSPG